MKDILIYTMEDETPLREIKHKGEMENDRFYLQ